MTARNPGARAVIARCCAPVLHPTRDSVRGLALASVIANAVLVRAGAGPVRVHVSVPVLPWIGVLRLYPSTRERRPLPAAAATQAGPATAARNPQAPEATLGV